MSTALQTTGQPWEQLPDETDTAYHRFSIYLKMGPDRTLEKTRKELGKASGYCRQLETWSSKYNWVKRVQAYDRYLIRKALKDKEEILEHGKARLLKMVDQALDQLEEVLLGDDVMFVGEGVKDKVGYKIKVAESILDRAGLVKQKDLPEVEKGVTTVHNYIQNIYNKIDNFELGENDG